MEASSSKGEGRRHMLEEELEEKAGENDDIPLPNLEFKLNKSTDSLGASSQYTNYSFGSEDISEAIIAFNPTQTSGSGEEPPDSATDSATSSENSLGKRKASQLSSMSSFGPFRPPKVPRPMPFDAPAGEDNPFGDNPPTEETPPEPENIYVPISISPNHTLQRIFTNANLPYGVQYEIARYVSLDKIKYGDVLVPNVFKLAELQSNREAVPATAKSILNDIIIEKIDDDDDNTGDGWKDAFAKERAAKSPWMELDREEEALRDNPYGGLGFNEAGEYLNWYGGQVLFHGKLQDQSPKGAKQPKYKITLERAELGPSFMFARRFGSKNFFRLKMTKLVLNTKKPDALLDYLRRPLILCGSVFRAFYAKESNVFYVKTNEQANGDKLDPGKTVEGVMPFLDFLEWHNPMDLNIKQTMAKYVSRFALGLSNSVPGLMVDRSNIKLIDDIISATGSNMTDGAGKINRWSMKQIRHRLDWEDTPTAIQTRILGTKGLLVDDGKNAEEVALVQVTPSQRKIDFPEGDQIDPAHRIIDVLRASHTKSPCCLSVETIMCLADNGVPKKVFVDLLQKGLAELVEPLLDWDSPDAMQMLWCNVRRLGGVMSARRAREEAGLARVKGYSDREAEDELEDEDGFSVDATENRSAAWWTDEISGCPSSLEETIMYMIDSGFTPQESPVLRDKLYKFIKGRINYYVKSYRIDVPMSASAFLVPDTSGILEPGEVFFKSSHRQFLLADGTESDIFIGDVLVTRHPCKLPTDIQKWKSVDKLDLHHLTDVIILSTKGDRRAADLLSGGDYDGDKGIFISQPEIVEQFTNAPLHYADPPPDIESNFDRENERVDAFKDKTASVSADYKIRLFQKYLLGAVCNTAVVGKYSNFHEIAIYTLGYRHEETIRLANMFCLTLDGIKTGMTVSASTFKKDSKKYQKRSPAWKEATEDREREWSDMNNQVNVKRPSALGKFIMDDLHRQATAEGDKWLGHIERYFESKGPCKLDQHLSAPWYQALEMGKRWQTEEKTSRMVLELEELKKHVETVYSEHRAEISSPRKTRTSARKGGASFTDLPIEIRQDTIRDLSKKFASFPPDKKFLMSDEEVSRNRASYAYVYDHERRAWYGPNNFTRFPFDVAMRELCLIKARALGHFKAVAGEHYDRFNMKHPKKHHL